jgi:short-chain fatty acids transporter
MHPSRWVPNSFVIACLLTLVTFGLVIAIAGTSPLAAEAYWTRGFWELLELTMQLALIVITGYIVAVSPMVSRLLEFIAGLASSDRAAIALMGLVSMTAAWMHWGLGLIAGPIFLHFLIRKHPRLDYRLAVAAGYLGSTCTWHAGLSGSVPLLMATPKNFMEAEAGLVPISLTTFSAFNLVLTAIVVCLMTAMVMWLYPKSPQTQPAASNESAEDPHAARGDGRALWIERSYALNLVMGLLGVVGFWSLYVEGGSRVSINVLNFAVLFLALLLHPNPASFTRAATRGATYLHGIVIQFPFYAGMYGLIKYSGLAEIIARWFTSIASPRTFPIFIYWYSGLLSFFIPSGGSKWAVEAPYVVAAAKALSVPIPQAILAYAWGDMSTHFLQPFWAIPLLAIAKVEFKDIIGYLAILFAVNFIVVSTAFVLLPYIW